VSQPFAEERFNAVRHPPTPYTKWLREALFCLWEWVTLPFAEERFNAVRHAPTPYTKWLREALFCLWEWVTLCDWKGPTVKASPSVKYGLVYWLHSFPSACLIFSIDLDG
jgi:hypothetical protein